MEKNPQYYEGILQLRNPSQQIIDFIAREIDKRGDVWIAKTQKYSNGIDIYLSSNKFLAHLGAKLKKDFTGELVKSKALYSRDRQTGKELFRGCILFKHYSIKKGDIIQIKGEKIQVLAVGKHILGKNLRSNRKIHLNFRQLPDQ